MKTLGDELAKTNFAQKIEEDYKRERRKGINPKTGRPYKALEQSTIKHRRYLARNNSTGTGYSATKSNVTMTGQLIDSIKAVWVRSRSVLKFTISGTRTPYRANTGRAIRNQERSNAEIAKHLEEQGRPVLYLTKKSQKLIIDMIKRKLRKFIK